MSDPETTPSLLIFLHIPKAAGTTFSRIVRQQYPAESIVQNDRRLSRVDIESLKALPDEQKRAVRVVQGHVGFGVHELFPQPARYVTFVRDPVARVMSHYRHVLRTERHYLHEEVVGRGLSLLDYARSGLSSELENGQTRQLVALDDSLVDSTPESLVVAKSHIREHFLLAGLTERFDESVLLIKRALGWDKVVYVRENVAPASLEPIDPETVDAIRERNALDVELYRFCEQLLGERLAAEGGSGFERELRLLRVRNAARTAATRPVRRLRRTFARR